MKLSSGQYKSPKNKLSRRETLCLKYMFIEHVDFLGNVRLLWRESENAYSSLIFSSKYCFLLVPPKKARTFY